MESLSRDAHWPIQMLGALCASGLLRVFQTRHNVLRLKTVARSTNSAQMLAKPLRRDRRALSCSFRMPKMGSINSLRRAYKCWTLLVVIQCRCFRTQLRRRVVCGIPREDKGRSLGYGAIQPRHAVQPGRHHGPEGLTAKTPTLDVVLGAVQRRYPRSLDKGRNETGRVFVHLPQRFQQLFGAHDAA